MIAGGAEAAITPLSVGGFAAMKALSTRNDDPSHACRPFDKDRDGFVVGEGAGILILEELEFAKARGANILAEVIGYGMSGDAFHMTGMAPEGEGCRRAMVAALKSANLDPDKIDYVNAHATSTPLGDALESKAIENVFGERAINGTLLVSSTKSMTGHLLGGAGGLEAGITVMAMLNQMAPPTMNIVELDPACRLNYVPNKPQAAKIDYALSNSFGFGGTNGSLVFKRWMASRFTDASNKRKARRLPGFSLFWHVSTKIAVRTNSNQKDPRTHQLNNDGRRLRIFDLRAIIAMPMIARRSTICQTDRRNECRPYPFSRIRHVVPKDWYLADFAYQSCRSSTPANSTIATTST